VSTPRQQQGGLSITTLAISAIASMAAAIVVHKFWKGGAIYGAAITPVVVALVSESLRRPVDRVTALREERRTRPHAQRGQVPVPPVTEPARADPYGIWEDDRQRSGLDPRHVKVALVTGLVAFAIGAFLLTSGELVFGGSVSGGGKKTTIFNGAKKKKKSEEKSPSETTATEATPTDTTATTPTDTTATAPAETTPTTTTPDPTATAPQASPTTPQTVPAAPPAETAPAAGQQTAPPPTP
jgi:hypothetical protein